MGMGELLIDHMRALEGRRNKNENLIFTQSSQRGKKRKISIEFLGVLGGFV
ncbi:MAG: hypothetical protein ACE5D4_04830 [Thermodesulfobacteriota bacterium]